VTSLLIKRATLLVTMDDQDHRWDDGCLYIVDQVIQQVGPTVQLPDTADRVIDARGSIILPGLVNTHHHFYQTLTRNLPAAQDADLFTWLRIHYPIWARLTPEAIAVSTQVALAELMLSGCTTSSDHTYIWPNGARLDDQIAAALQMGVRFHAARGSMSVGESQGGLPPDSVVEDEDAILADSQRVIEQYHDANRYAMLRIVLAPCSPFSVSPELMRQSVKLARAYGVQAHTHLAETRDEAEYCQMTFGRTPVELAEDLGWTGPDVWHAHMVHPSASEIERLGRTRTGVAHCPTSNLRLGAGVAPVRDLLDAEHAAGVGHRAAGGAATGRGARGSGSGRLGLQRWLAPAGGGAASPVAAPGPGRPRGSQRACGAAVGDARRRGGAGARRHWRAGARYGGRLHRLPAGHAWTGGRRGA